MQQPKNNIILLSPYYGAFPWFFPYFLHSCKFNPTIDFLIFSDIPYEKELPPNVTIINQSLAEIKALASRQLNLDISLTEPYKLCDFRPAFGVIFSAYLEQYAFWGQCDLDIICGDIRKFITDEILQQYDFISARHDYTAGCFCLYRNCDVVNNAFRRSRDYRTVFTAEKYMGFDEFNLEHYPLMFGKTIFDIRTEVETFTHIMKDPARNEGIRTFFDFMMIEGTPGRLKFDKGRLIYKGQYEAILYHLYWLKRVYHQKNVPAVIPDNYSISKRKIYFY